MTEIVGVVLVVLLASSVQAIAGFGLALFAVPLLSFVVEPKVAVVVVGSIGFAASSVLAWQERAHVERTTAGRMILGAAIGSPIGLVLLQAAPGRVLRLALAVAIVVFLVVQLRGLRLDRVGPRLDIGAGFVSGTLNTSLSTNGPPLVAVLHARHLEPATFRGTLSVVFAASNVIAVALFAGAGRYDTTTLGFVAAGIPTLLVGQSLGVRVRRRVPPEGFRRVVTGMLALTAVASVVAAVRG